MRIYEMRTIVELTEQQHDRLDSLVKEANKKGCKLDRKEALEFLCIVRFPDFWDIQLNLLEKMIQKL